ncbi:MAG: HAMP domain-containing histidine kinase [Deltaproteobacteria bacterium]|nr:HAMP domain-containing histidine kinase [Deltaproteobacteria bacterium]
MDDPSLGQKLTLDDLVPEGGLVEICRSFRDLFGVEVRVVPRGQTIEQPRLPPRAAYRTAEVSYDGEVLGTLVLGPYMPSDSVVSLSLTGDAGPPPLPRMKDPTAERLLRHLASVLDVVLWSGHRAFLASRMQISSSQELHRELVAKNRALTESLERVKELDRLKSNFLGTVSHELRTPLTSILGYAEMLAEGLAGALNEEQIEFVGTIREKGQHLLSLISSVLDLSKLDAEAALVDVSEVDVGALCEGVVTAAMAGWQKRGLDVKVAIGQGVPKVRTDLERLRKVVSNLLDNAIKFTPTGGTVQVAVGVKTPPPEMQSPVGLALLAPADQLVEIAVADTGIGIAQENQPRVFDAFYQVDGSSTRQYGGTGLGLSIVKRLIESLGGRVSVSSTLGTGSTFRVELPVEPGSE